MTSNNYVLSSIRHCIAFHLTDILWVIILFGDWRRMREGCLQMIRKCTGENILYSFPVIILFLLYFCAVYCCSRSCLLFSFFFFSTVAFTLVFISLISYRFFNTVQSSIIVGGCRHGINGSEST